MSTNRTNIISTIENYDNGEHLAKSFYCIPIWCRMHPLAHFDGMGGCWGISNGCVLEDGEDYCLDCEFHKDNVV